jgi:hypothetical protein
MGPRIALDLVTIVDYTYDIESNNGHEWDTWESTEGCERRTAPRWRERLRVRVIADLLDVGVCIWKPSHRWWSIPIARGFIVQRGCQCVSAKRTKNQVALR